MSLKRPRSDSDSADDTNRSCSKRVNDESDDPLSRLFRLSDFTSLNLSQDVISQFSAIAEILLNEVQLQITSAQASQTSTKTPAPDVGNYKLLEVEFYLWKDGSHEDPFTHGSEQQKHSGRWYFHRAPTKATGTSSSFGSRKATAAGGYRGGTRKGLDLTFGSPMVQRPTSKVASHYFPTPQNESARNKTPALQAVDIRGGILLRTMRRVSDNKVISGPSLLVDEILRVSGASSIATLVNEMLSSDTMAWSSPSRANSTRTSLQLVPITKTTLSSNQPKTHIYSSPRIGLDLSHSSIPVPTAAADTERTLKHPRLSFLARPYRYFVHPELLTANGRGHTFYGVYRSLTTSEEHSETKLKRELVRVTDLKPNTVDKYLKEYLESVKEGCIKDFIGQKGKGAGSNPVTALSMFGTLKLNGL
ncbi:hypothetical protein BDY19DRAFT_993243 [Irpex rosettiformis]|uniref:Uncharacterized protein n=1 Tax=Irpex rosettiformis TaxID=378272 RepID=A0ACB8U5M1_9APHY|nr:hypothetical protein BDY19DRAFT_993243 [Irpex rosettiformis]